MQKNNKSKVSIATLEKSEVKTAILFLTSNQIPKDENFDFVNMVVESFDNIKDARQVLYENYYNEILEWSQMSDW
jgi:hypothetical protein